LGRTGFWSKESTIIKNAESTQRIALWSAKTVFLPHETEKFKTA
jgi:hypothetical protein